MPSWQFSKVNATAKNLGLEGFSTMQLHHNPLYREEEREMLDLCAADNIATLAWSPLARGLVAKGPENTSLRVETDQYREWYSRENDVQIIDIINQIAVENEITMAQVSLSWQINRIGITSPIIGATRISHLEEAVEAVHINLNEDYYKRLEEVYTPRFVIGH